MRIQTSLTERKTTTNKRFQQKHDAEQTYDKITNNKQQTTNPHVMAYKQTQKQKPIPNIQTNKNYEQVAVQTGNSNSITKKDNDTNDVVVVCKLKLQTLL